MTRWMETAWACEGVAEVPGPDANPRILAMFDAIGRSEVRDDVTAWCAAGVGYCLVRADISLASIPAHERLLARSYLKFGTPLGEPRPGAIAVFVRPDGGPHAGHVGFVVGHDETHLHILGFNQSDAVNVRRFPRAQLLGLRWPPVDQVELAQSSRIIAASDRAQADAVKISTVPPGGHIGLPTELPDIDAMVGKASAFRGTVETVASFATFVGRHWWLIALVLTAWWGARIAHDAWLTRTARIEDATTGKTSS